MISLFIVGPPGVGKTTLVRAMLASAGGYDCIVSPKWTIVPGKIAAAGHYVGGSFDGADTVGYNQVHKTLDFWRAQILPIPLTIFDGDRFSHKKVVDFCKAIPNMQVRVAYMFARGSLIEERRAARDAVTGKTQNAAWVTGRYTKARRFEAEHGGASINAELLLPDQLAALQKIIKHEGTEDV